MARNNASIMRQTIVLQQRVMGPDEYGNMGGPPTWQDAAILAASYEPLVGREVFLGSNMPQKDAQFDARVRIRLRKGINPAEHQIVYAGIVHDIINVTYDRERSQTVLYVKARASGQAEGSKVNV